MAEIKLHGSQARHASACYKHVVVTLKPGQTISQLRETPTAWSAIQSGDRSLILNKGDEVTVVSDDGRRKWDRLPVLKALEGSVWLGKPPKVIDLDAVDLWENNVYRIVPVGTGFSLQHKRGDRTEDDIFLSVDKAKHEALRRQPVQAA